MKQDIQVAEQENKTKAIEVTEITEITEVPTVNLLSGHPKADPAFQCKAGKRTKS